jgi:DNA invertase Pin-like site-specific DNA recombinase
VFAIEASRLARNGRDWHTLIEFCGLVGTIIIDEDGVYDPRQPNDRLLQVLDVPDEAKSARELLAQNILALAHQGERSAALLCDRTLRGIAYGQGGWPVALVRAARCAAL